VEALAESGQRRCSEAVALLSDALALLGEPAVTARGDVKDAERMAGANNI
jgi:hypothetical protein